MPTQEQINAANVELEIANDNYAALADRYNKYKEMFQSYANASPEAQDRAADVMWRALEDFYQTQEKMRAAEDRIAVAQNAVNAINETIAQQQAITRSRSGWRRNVPPVNELDWWWDMPDNGFVVREWWMPVYNDKWEIVWEQKAAVKLRPNVNRPNSFTWRKAAISDNQESWEDIYNAWGWNEFKKWFNNALVDDLVLPVASAFGASGDTLWVLSELKIPATEREMASKYYALWWWGKDAADAYLQYAGMKWLSSIPGLVNWAKWAETAYTVANSWRWIYNTPNAWQTVNRFWSNYTPAYWGNGARILKTAWNRTSSLPNISFTSLW